MRVIFAGRFVKQFRKLPAPFREQFFERLKLLADNPSDPRLRLHPLRGKYAGHWSINVNGDLRALFMRRGDDIVIFAMIGTHRGGQDIGLARPRV